MAEQVYNFKNKHRGLAVVIVNETFDCKGLKERRGADKDLINMKTLFNKFGFRVKAYKNLSKKKMQDKLDRAALKMKFHKESDCFVCVISTHGEEMKHTHGQETTTQNALFGTDGGYIYTSDITRQFRNCCELEGKPKLFFIQACRSSEGQAKADMGHEIMVEHESDSATDQSGLSERLDDLHFDAFPTQESTENEDEDVSDDEWQESQLPPNWMNEEEEDEEEEEETEQDAKGKGDAALTVLPPSRIACYTDELIMWPIVSGLYAVRDIKTGSCMLTFLFDELLKMLPTEPLLHALTRVSYRMSYELPLPNHKSKNKIVSCITHRLTKEVYFTLKEKYRHFKKF
ncbi:hypothetical protein CHS0354_033122 [Potamilus streckersoni]|uniref:Uncharacterized protein n=1 Tax=Potamilus streckersoni TaxID=2493646 RepID=A0AAE0VR62_9BIVA|nr:hypothetical protein CHS0354_033122 [Potamilus streckersoni]